MAFFNKWINKGQAKLDEWEKLFSILGGGNKVYLESSREKDCHITKDPESGDWHVQIHMDTPTEVALHEGCHQLYSTFSLPRKLQTRVMAHPKSLDLANVMEDVRINRKGGDWYSQDLLGFQRTRLKRNKLVAAEISDDISCAVANEVFELDKRQGNEEFTRVIDKHRKAIWKACDGDDALATTRVACDIMEELNLQTQQEQDRRAGESPVSCQVVGNEGENNENRDGETGQLVPPEGNSTNPYHQRFRPTSLQSSGRKHQPVQMLEVEQEPIVANFSTQLFIESQARSNERKKTNLGQPTHKVWQINQGKMRVFEKPEKRRGKVLVMVDLSGSMGCWCEHHKHRDRSGYIAFQTVKAITSRADAEVYGFCCTERDYIVPLRNGYQPLCRKETQGIPSGNPDCAALMWMGEKLKGLGRDALAIFISDGQPAASCGDTVAHTKAEARNLRAQGLEFANILINTDDYGCYPGAVQAMVTTPEEIFKIQPVLDLMGDKWG